MDKRKMMVPLRGTGAEKAEAVRTLLSRVVTKGSDKISKRAGVVTYSANTRAGRLVLRWDVDGHFLYEESGIRDGQRARKVRNVAEAVRLAGG